MELSPRAKERLARIGSLSAQENEELVKTQEVEELLSSYFTGKITIEELWRLSKDLKDRRGDRIINDEQDRLLGTLRLLMNDDDMKQRSDAILALETLKQQQKHRELELIFSSIMALRNEYSRTKEQAYEQLKSGMEAQLQAAAQQAGRQGIPVDMNKSLEANVKNSNQWKSFIMELEKETEAAFSNYINKLRELILS